MESTMHLTCEGDRQRPTSLLVSWLFSEGTVLVPSDGIPTVVNRRYTQNLSKRIVDFRGTSRPSDLTPVGHRYILLTH
jgi:hypothetical protein